MNPTAVFSKSGKGVQEASGKTSHLSRADRAVLAAFDGRITVADVAEKVGKPFDPKFEQLIEQLEKDGFVRQVSPGVAPAQPAQAARPGAAGKPPAPALGEELDFTIFAAPKAAPSKPSAPGVDLAAKAREEAERKAKEEHATSYKARQEIERARMEAEARAKAASQARLQAEAAAKAKADAETKAKADADSSARAKAAEAEAKVRAEAEAKVKAARDAAVRLAAEAKAKAEADLEAKLEAERAKGREEAERIRKEAEEKSRREAEELRQRLEEERKAREEERKAREEAEAARRKAEEQARAEAERARKEAEEKARKEAEEKARKEAEELRQRLEEERKAREEAEAARKKAEAQAREEERRRREEDERRSREEAARKEREEKERAERKAREDKERAEREERQREEKERAEREKEEKERAEREKKERKERERAEKERAEREEREEREQRERKEKERREKAEREQEEETPAAAPAATGSFSDSLLADLDSFGQREDEERKAREAAEAAKKKAQQQARAEAERQSREQAERREKEEAERRKRDEAERKAKAEAERRAEEEAREAEARAADERKRKAREAVAAKAAAEDDDIGVTDEDLDMDEVKRDQKALSQEARRAARERERELEREREKAKGREREAAEEDAPVAAAAPARVRRPIKWGKPVALVLFLLLAAGIGAVHVMPVSTGAYERAASEALGVPVKIGSARVSLFTGVQLKLDNVTAGPAKVATARAFPAIGSLLGEKKTFSRIELDGVGMPQELVGAALLAKARGANFEVERIVAKNVKLEGPLVLPALDADLALGAEGSVTAGTVRGPEGLIGKLAVKGSEVEFDVHSNSFALPVAPEVALNQFDMKGVAARDGMDISAWSATLYDGVMSGTAKLGWGPSYGLEGVVTVRGMNVGVFAPALVSEGKVEGTGRFSMGGADAGKPGGAARLEGNFNIAKGVLGSFDISRALSTGGRQVSGRTPFTEMVGQGVYDKGAVQLRNITIGAGALNAGASVDIAPSGALSGRIVADVRAATQTLRATLNLGGTVKEPQVRN